MLTSQIQALAAAKARVAKLEESIATSLNGELAALPARFGFANVNAFVAAVKAASRKRRERKPSAKTAALKRRKRAKITDAIRADVKKLIGDGKTGAEIAKALGISLPSVQNIKKALGLVGKAKSKRKAKPEQK